MFGGWTHYRELLTNSLEGIASNILADRLAKLVEAGLLTRHDEPGHKQKIDYRLTEASIQLIPALAALGRWGAGWLPTDPDLRIRAEILAAGGPQMWAELMDELRDRHLHRLPTDPDGVLARLCAVDVRAI
jgi:DNA-binding HxlR family transcriptional regulator